MRNIDTVDGPSNPAPDVFKNRRPNVGGFFKQNGCIGMFTKTWHKHGSSFSTVAERGLRTSQSYTCYVYNLME